MDDKMVEKMMRDSAPYSLNELYLTTDRSESIKNAFISLKQKFQALFPYVYPGHNESNYLLARNFVTTYINEKPQLIQALIELTHEYPEIYNYIMSFIIGTRLDELEASIKTYEESNQEDRLQNDSINKSVVSQFRLLSIFLDIDTLES